MKILAVTMGRFLQVFLNIHSALQKQREMEAPALFIADSLNYLKTVKNLPELSDFSTLKEWELMQQGSSVDPDFQRIATYQQELSESLWNALLCDRRVFFGRLTKSKQDYVSHYSYKQLMGILDTFLWQIDSFLDAQKPDVVLSFSTTTVGDYIFELLSKQKGIRFFQLKGTKVSNKLTLNDTGMGISSHLIDRLLDNTPFAEDVRDEAVRYIDDVKSKGLRYEGSILFSWQRTFDKLKDAPVKLFEGSQRAVRFRRMEIVQDDKHIPPPLSSAWNKNVCHPIRTFYLGKKLPYLSSEELQQQGPYLFYPLHFEPEVSLQVFGRPFQNQIELIRLLAYSVPAHMTVVVKEHPRSMGFRKLSYYKKLLAIPNVVLVDPFLPARAIVEHADIVAVVTGSIGLEAAICHKPVLVFGVVNYELFPDTMVRKVVDLSKLAQLINEMLQNYRYEEESIIRFVSAIIEDSVSVNMYTGLLNKKGRFSDGEEADNLADSYVKLSTYLLKKLEYVNN